MGFGFWVLGPRQALKGNTEGFHRGSGMENGSCNPGFKVIGVRDSGLGCRIWGSRVRGSRPEPYAIDAELPSALTLNPKP